MDEHMSAAEVIAAAFNHFTSIDQTEVSELAQSLAAVAAVALREAGWELVKLPQPDQDDEDGIGWGYEPLTDWGVFVSRDIVDGRVYDQNGGVKPADARLIASWWLAAAAAVSQDGESDA